jgi:hypothetical protein
MVPTIALMKDERSLEYFEEGLWRDFAASGAGAGAGCWPALGRLNADLTLRERLRDKIKADRRRASSQLELLGPLTRQQIRIGLKSVREQQAQMDEDPRSQAMAQQRRVTHRWFAEEALAKKSSLPAEVEADFRTAGLIMLLTWPVLWVVWAFLWRGGFSYRIMRIDLVRSDGRPALRVQCAWRALLVWAPVTAVLLLSLWLQNRFWSDLARGEQHLWLHTLSTALWYAALALLGVFVALALARPGRSLHDRLAGTYLVPR